MSDHFGTLCIKGLHRWKCRAAFCLKMYLKLHLAHVFGFNLTFKSIFLSLKPNSQELVSSQWGGDLAISWICSRLSIMERKWRYTSLKAGEQILVQSQQYNNILDVSIVLLFQTLKQFLLSRRFLLKPSTSFDSIYWLTWNTCAGNGGNGKWRLGFVEIHLFIFYKQLGSGPNPQSCLYFQDF